MHIRAIGHPASPLDPGVIDQPVKDWPGITYDPNVPANNRGSYGSSFTKWAAQSNHGLITDAIDNAENYALFATAYYIQKNLGYYPHLRQVAISPTDSNDILSSDVDGPSEANLSAAGFVDDSPFNYNIYCYTHFD
ncbi:hypothetical protein K431DRAFT_127981 [Polychaeton citri CBS 116435]|uniref:Uncharacterized protein n=1 Tax=Polychaeton citri CBS 116435 TaxID=1314669 RepID=A0A9P4UK21_9PEZI|nr:hypothetical protein K431DRAFT_127981 [Polychaeton citri CBS 116435]